MSPKFEIVKVGDEYRVMSGDTLYGPPCRSKKAAEELQKDWEDYYEEEV